MDDFSLPTTATTTTTTSFLFVHDFFSVAAVVTQTAANSSQQTNGTHTLLLPGQVKALEATKIVIGTLSFGSTFLYVLYVLIYTLYTFPYRSLYQYLTKAQQSQATTTTQNRRRLRQRIRARRLKAKARKQQRQLQQQQQTLGQDLLEATDSDDEDEHTDIAYVTSDHDDTDNNVATTTTIAIGGNNGNNGDIGDNRETVTTFRQFWNALTTECYFFSRPLARIFFLLQLCECIAVTYTLFEILQITNPFICYYQYIVIQFFGLAKYGWSLIIAIWMFWILALRKGNAHLKVLEVASHLIVWPNAILFSVIPLATNSVGDSGSYCWIKGSDYHKYIRFTHYIPLWTMIVIILVIYVVTFSMILRVQCSVFGSSNRKKKMALFATSAKLYIKLIGFPLVFVTLWTVPTIRRFVEMVWEIRGLHKTVPFSILYVHAITSPANGFWYSVVFVLSELVGMCSTTVKKHQQKKDKLKMDEVELDNTGSYVSMDHDA